MNKKTLFLMVTLIAISILIFVLMPKNDKREPITIISHASYVNMSLDELIYESDLIVIGNLNTVYASRWNTPDGKRPGGDSMQNVAPENVIFTDSDFNVTQLLKGDMPQQNVRIRSLGGKVDGDQMIADKVIPEMNKTYLLFLDLDTKGSTAQIIPDHYWITGGGFQGQYEVVSNKAISTSAEWTLDELIAYIQNSPLSAASPNLPDTPEVKEIMQAIETAYNIEAEAAYSFNTEKFPSVFVNDLKHEINPEKLEFIRFFINDPALEQVGYLDYKTAYYNWWNDSTIRFEALKEKAAAENREITQEEINSFIDSKWSMAPARAESPERKTSLRFISVDVINDTAIVYLHDGFQVVILYMDRIDGQWYIAGDKENSLSENP